jgi:hypothetical protein
MARPHLQSYNHLLLTFNWSDRSPQIRGESLFRDRTTISRSSRYRCLGIFFRSTLKFSSLCRLKSPEPVTSSSLRPRPSIIPDQAEAWEEPQSWHCGSSCFNCPDHANCHGLSPRQRKASFNCHRPGKDNRVAVMPTYRQDVRTRSYCQSHPRRDAALSRRPSSAIRLSHACSLFAHSNEAGDVVRSLRFTGVINFLECALGLFECADTRERSAPVGLRSRARRRR